MDDELEPVDDLEQRLAVEIEMKREIHTLKQRIERLEERFDNLVSIVLRLLGKEEERNAYYWDD